MKAPDLGTPESLRACIAAYSELAMDNARARFDVLKALKASGATAEREALKALRASAVEMVRAADVLERHVILRLKALDEGRP